jgi:hypothetical protein
MIFAIFISFSYHITVMTELLEPGENRLEDVNLEGVQTVGHSSFQARGTVTYDGEEYDLTVTDTGNGVRIRAASEEEVYLTNLDENLNRNDIRYGFEELIRETEMDLAYTNKQSIV